MEPHEAGGCIRSGREPRTDNSRLSDDIFKASGEEHNKAKSWEAGRPQIGLCEQNSEHFLRNATIFFFFNFPLKNPEWIPSSNGNITAVTISSELLSDRCLEEYGTNGRLIRRAVTET